MYLRIIFVRMELIRQLVKCYLDLLKWRRLLHPQNEVGVRLG